MSDLISHLGLERERLKNVNSLSLGRLVGLFTAGGVREGGRWNRATNERGARGRDGRMTTRSPEGPSEGRWGGGTETQINMEEGGEKKSEGAGDRRREGAEDGQSLTGWGGRERKGRATKAAMRQTERKNLYINYGCGSKDNGALLRA